MKNQSTIVSENIANSNVLKDGYTFNINTGAIANPQTQLPILTPAQEEVRRKRQLYIGLGTLAVMTILIVFISLKKK